MFNPHPHRGRRVTRKDDAPTFVVAKSDNGSVFHLSEDGRYTLCHWAIRGYWQQYDERVPFFTVLLSGIKVCSLCKKAAQEAAA